MTYSQTLANHILDTLKKTLTESPPSTPTS